MPTRGRGSPSAPGIKYNQPFRAGGWQKPRWGMPPSLPKNQTLNTPTSLQQWIQINKNGGYTSNTTLKNKIFKIHYGVQLLIGHSK